MVAGLIAFWRFFNVGEPSETADVMVVRPGGSGVRNLTREGCTGDCLGSETPAWSRDGRQIAFERALGPLDSEGRPSSVGIWVMNADGSHVRQLTQFRPGLITEDHGATWAMIRDPATPDRREPVVRARLVPIAFGI